jgi:hypothetical protein
MADHEAVPDTVSSHSFSVQLPHASKSVATAAVPSASYGNHVFSVHRNRLLKLR